MFIIECENGGEPWWLNGTTGDPGRTIVRNNAQIFHVKKTAQNILTRTINRNLHRNLKGRMRIVPVRVDITEI